MTAPARKRATQPSSCPTGWFPAGHVVPLSLTVQQTDYCRRAIGIARFVFNLCLATHQFCRTNRLLWPSWQDLDKELNAIKHDQFPFVTEVSYAVAEGAVRDFGTAIANWRNPHIHARRPPSRKSASPAPAHSALPPASKTSTTTANAASDYPASVASN